MERVYRAPSTTVSGGEGIVQYFKDNIETLGWTIYDDRVSEDDYIVVKSEGFESNNGRLPCYLKLHFGGYYNFIMYVYWDNSSHIGHVPLAYSTTPDRNTTGGRFDAYPGVNTVYMKGNKDFIFFNNTKVSNGLSYVSFICRINMPFWGNYVLVEWQSETSPGVNVIVQLAEGQASQLKIGRDYRVISPYGYVDKPVVGEIDYNQDQITLNNLYYTLSSGTLMGYIPYPWLSYGADVTTYDAYFLGYDTTNWYYTTPNSNWRGMSFSRADGSLGGSSVAKYNGQEEYIAGIVFYDTSSDLFGGCSYLGWIHTGADHDVFGVNQIDVGSVSSGTLGQISDNNKNWINDVLKGKKVVITSGQQSDASYYITGNTSNTFMVDPDFSAVISGSETYSIVESVFKRSTGLHPYHAVAEV